MIAALLIGVFALLWWALLVGALELPWWGDLVLAVLIVGVLWMAFGG